MSSKNEERIKNPDGSELKVQGYDNKIVVHMKDADGNEDGYATDWFDNQVHVHGKDGSASWEGQPPKDKKS